MLYTRGNTMMEVRQLNVGNNEPEKLIARPRRVNAYQSKTYVNHNYEADETELIPTVKSAVSTASNNDSSVVSSTARVVPVQTVAAEDEPQVQKSADKSSGSQIKQKQAVTADEIKMPLSKVTTIQTPIEDRSEKPTKSLALVQMAMFVIAAFGMFALLGLEQTVVVSNDQYESELRFSWAQVVDSTESLRSSLFAHVIGWKQ